MIEVDEQTCSRIELYIESTLNVRRLRRLGKIAWTDDVGAARRRANTAGSACAPPEFRGTMPAWQSRPTPISNG